MPLNPSHRTFTSWWTWSVRAAEEYSHYRSRLAFHQEEGQHANATHANVAQRWVCMSDEAAYWSGTVLHRTVMKRQYRSHVTPNALPWSLFFFFFLWGSTIVRCIVTHTQPSLPLTGQTRQKQSLWLVDRLMAMHRAFAAHVVIALVSCAISLTLCPDRHVRNVHQPHHY